MLFLEGVIVNVVIFVIFMYIDRYLLENYCREHKTLSLFFKSWLILTFILVLLALLKATAVVEVTALP